MIKTYFSRNYGDKYIIRENITPNKRKRIQEMGISNCDVDIINKNFYITDGLFVVLIVV